MKLYAVFLKDHGRKPDRDMVLVKEGFSWPAFLMPPLWALWSRMWWEALALFAVIALFAWGLEAGGVPEHLSQVSMLALVIAIGMIGNDLKRWSLSQRGFSEVATIGAKNADEAERRFLQDATLDADGIYP